MATSLSVSCTAISASYRMSGTTLPSRCVLPRTVRMVNIPMFYTSNKRITKLPITSIKGNVSECADNIVYHSGSECSVIAPPSITATILPPFLSGVETTTSFRTFRSSCVDDRTRTIAVLLTTVTISIARWVIRTIRNVLCPPMRAVTFLGISLGCVLNKFT